MNFRSIRGTIATFAVITAIIAACDESPTDPRYGESETPPIEVPGDQASWALLNCTGTLAEPTLSCSLPTAESSGVDARADDGLSRIIVGGQGINVLLESSNVAYDAGTQRFTFDVTVRNLLPQPLATADGATLHPEGTRVFFHSDPVATAGTGAISVEADGVGTYTGAAQPFYQYDEIIGTGERSAPRGWTLIVPSSVERFDFQVFVSAAVPFPDGFVDPGIDSLLLRTGDTLRLRPVVRSATGAPLTIGDPFVFATSDSAVVVVDEEGLVTAVSTGEAVVTVGSGTLSGQVVVNVAIPLRRWTGAVSSDWAEPGNWFDGFVPADGDSVHVPVVEAGGHPAVLTSPTTIGHLAVDEGATLDLGDFDLTVTGDVRTGAAGGIQSAAGHLILAGTDRAIAGILPRTRITGSYSLAAETTIAGALTLRGGTLSGAGHLLSVQP